MPTQRTRYQEFEKLNNGDVIRGLKNLELPWLLEDERFQDGDGDTWILTINCTKIQPEPAGKNLIFSLECKAQCIASRSTIARLGYTPERLHQLADTLDFGLEHSSIVQVTDSITNLDKRTLPILTLFRKALLQKFGTEEKSKRILAQIQTHRVSRFSAD